MGAPIHGVWPASDRYYCNLGSRALLENIDTFFILLRVSKVTGECP